MRTLVSSLFLVCAVSAAPQEGAVLPASTRQDARHGLPGTLPGTERWIVTFKERSFDLAEFRSLSLRNAPAAEVNPVVAQYERQTRTDQARFVAEVESRGGRVTHQWWLVNCCAIEIAPERLAALAALPNVLKLDPDEIAVPLIVDCTNAANHNSDYANTVLRTTGVGVTTAVMDTGLDENMNGTGRPHRTYFVNGDPTNMTGGGIGGSRLLVNRKLGLVGPDDVLDHGTGVSSVIMGFKWSPAANHDSGHAPDAKVAGYCIANDSAGSSDFTTIMNAWQAIATDRATYGIQTANNSYSGTPDPTNPSQMALDSCALNANVLVVVAAGNNGTSTANSQSCANGLAAAACAKNTRLIAGFSCKGPLSGDTTRFYPDITAIGVQVIMAKRDNETSQYLADGTSFASPNTCGSASLVRSARPAYSALDTKAILLLTAEDIASQNPTGNRNHYGLGFVRSDRATDFALNGNAPISGQLTTAVPKKTYPLPVTQGKAYGVVVTWHRTNFATTTWSNLDLRVLDAASNQVGASVTPRNLYERVNFLAAATGTYQIEVNGTSLDAPAVSFSVAYGEVPAPYIPGSYITYGAGCKGTGQAPGPGVVFPVSEATKFANGNNNIPFSWTPTRYQQVFNGNDNPVFVALSMGLRQDDQFQGFSGATIDMEARMGVTTFGPATLTSTFANNFNSGPPTQAVSRKNVVLPNMPPTLPTDPTVFFIDIPFDAPVPFSNSGGLNLLLEIAQYGNNQGSQIFTYPLDFGQTITTTRLWGTGATAPTGTLGQNQGLIFIFRVPGGGGAIPRLTNSGTPEISQSFTLNLGQAAPNTAFLLFTGFSKTTWNGIPLPFDLGPLGGPGCSLLAPGTIVEAGVTSGGGAGSMLRPLPGDKGLIGLPFFDQFVIFDPSANALQFVTTNGGQGNIGGQP